MARERKAEDLAERVTRLREALPGPPTPKELSLMMGSGGLSVHTVRGIERGAQCNPRLDTLRQLAAVLRVSVAELIGEE